MEEGRAPDVPQISLDDALLAVTGDLSYLVGQAAEGSKSLRAALSRPGGCSGPEDFSRSLQALVAKADSLTEVIVGMEAQTSECISLAELLGHCEAALGDNQKRLSGLQDHLGLYGYQRPATDSGAAEPTGESADDATAGSAPDSPQQEDQAADMAPDKQTTISLAEMARNHRKHADPEDQSPPLNIHALGLSKASLAAIQTVQPSPELDDLPLDDAGWASQHHQGAISPVGEDQTSNTMELYREIISRHTPHHDRGPSCQSPPGPAAQPTSSPPQATPSATRMIRPRSSIRKPLSDVNYTELAKQRSAVKKPRERVHKTIKAVAKEEFDGMPTFLVSRLSLETLNKAVGGINAAVHRKVMSGAEGLLGPEDLDHLSLGVSSQSVLGCLVRMDRILLDTSMGKTVYRVLA